MSGVAVEYGDQWRGATLDASPAQDARRTPLAVGALRPRVTVVVPTRNELLGVGALIEGLLATAPSGETFEILFVDDSDDGTDGCIDGYRRCGHPVSLLHRPPPERAGGLGGAVALGFERALGTVLVVMDGDLQHPPELAWRLAAAAGALGDVVVASRFVPGGGADGLEGPARRAVSEGTRFLARALVPRARGVRDPLSGFFALRREVVDGGLAASGGFKILLDVLQLGSWSTVLEVPFTLDRRGSGRSKASLLQGLRFLGQLWRLRAGGPAC